MNIKLLRRIKAHILEEPKRLNMTDWIAASDDAPCGTVACVAGWAHVLSGGDPKVPEHVAARSGLKALGIDVDSSEEQNLRNGLLQARYGVDCSNAIPNKNSPQGPFGAIAWLAGASRLARFCDCRTEDHV